MSEKSRVQFCWDCGNKLCKNHYAERFIDGEYRILHKQCAKKYNQIRVLRIFQFFIKCQILILEKDK